MEDVISVSQLRKNYGDFTALGGISFSVKKGEVLALLGPNGAGKTTTVEILEGFRTKSSGEVSILGMDPQCGGRKFKNRIGILLQECSIDPFLKVHEVLDQRATFYHDAIASAELLALTGLEDKQYEKVKKLSGGQQRRLDLALALVGNPEIIFLDEPTTGFDPSARHESWQIIRKLCSQGRTVLLTTHYMDEAQSLADNVVIIAKGEIVASGTPETLGGRDSAATIITFSVPLGLDIQVAGIECTSEDRDSSKRVTIETLDTVETLYKLSSWMLENKIQPGNLEVSQPTLEDIYLKITSEDNV